ncbi:DNA (cytosine-5)-methyltransferase DRM2-like isoform X1 [Salvia hispanica]|uniref:DNA (cytosine-5)-methyltransferase DRM2-like isoform X1 n=2 Tax=Salvia hispanica TaxID=49212 RepID=UPI0020091873|nr:DNA (cytosine-5)-methyltransferase DRM2-like isoform X1 [Salvia hispanica]XP_047966578.1 DNA (cytosine-5)-methyltransferase DRM2-like isoform X1 [Salvia hispanica]XP_047966579.1 DNA (cytosine-5)-methyltransferase DRM2-like isoform X1 [Salvia hispanica]
MDANVSGGDSSDVDWTSSDEESETHLEAGTSPQPTRTETIVGNEEASSSNATRSKLIGQFVGMGFSEKLVLKAIDENGEEDPDSILNWILTFSTLEESPPQQLSTNSDPCSSDYNEIFPYDLSDMDSWSEDEAEVCEADCLKDNGDYKSEKHKMLLSLAESGSLSEKETKLLALANMGYALEDAEIALERSGPETSVDGLIEFICVAQMAREQDCYLPEDGLKARHILNGSSKSKKRKLSEMKKKVMEESIQLPNPMIGYGVPSMQPPERVHRSLPEESRGPPYFYYENVALTPKGVWQTISRFLYDIEPEFVDSKFFSACARKRGYIHNLPIENRFPLIPLPPLTIQQAFPLSKRWWPTWDPRDKLNCIQTAIASAKLTERIRTVLERHEGDDDPPEAVQRYVMEQCRKWNLVWVGRNKAAPLEPDEVEMLLGFPKNHTRGGGISRTDRYKSLGNSFQVDTVAYHLSVLKDMYPQGINMLSLFSGIGGAEVALHRLGIKLNNVVSIEKSKANRDIVRSWWEQTNQTGSLIDFDDVQLFDAPRAEQIISSIGGFDLVVGGSPCNNLAGSNRVSRDGLEGKESSLFYDYFRILDLIKCIMGSNRAV